MTGEMRVGKSEGGEGSGEEEPLMDSMTPQLWRFLGEPVVLTEMIGRVFFQGEWGQSRLGIKHAEWAAPKARDQMCSKCGCTGFATFEEAWTHKVKCMPEEREVQDWVQRMQAAEAVTDAIGSEREVEMEDSTVGRSSDDESTASVSQVNELSRCFTKGQVATP